MVTCIRLLEITVKMCLCYNNLKVINYHSTILPHELIDKMHCLFESQFCTYMYRIMCQYCRTFFTYYIWEAQYAWSYGSWIGAHGEMYTIRLYVLKDGQGFAPSWCFYSDTRIRLYVIKFVCDLWQVGSFIHRGSQLYFHIARYMLKEKGGHFFCFPKWK